MEHKYFPNNTQLYAELHKLHKEFDPSESMVMTRYSFKDIQGEQYLAYDFVTFVDKFNDRFGMTIDRANSQSAGKQSYLIKFLSTDDKPKEIKVEPAKVVVPVTASDKQDTTIDWDFINSLANTKEDKLKLESYAEDNFKITLKRSMTLEKMIGAFKEALN